MLPTEQSETPAVLFSSLKVHFIDYSAAVELINNSISLKKKFIINYINAYSVVLANKDEDLKSALNASDLVHPDGIGIWLAAKILFKIRPLCRFNWTDHGDDFLKICEENRWRILFLGSTKDVLIKASEKIKRKFPRLQLVGTLNGYEDLNSETLIEEINSKNPDILYVGMGTPKQEKWIYNNAEKINCRVIQSVGDLFNLFAGEKVRGPKFFRKIGFEWFFRLLSSPKKYSGRYLAGIPCFIIIVLKEYFLRKSQ
jgi:N-acetylglucosaminyldiphosphoundecaprenol N-acetyl-beta-D-mannosaminyltransferase